MANNEKSKNTLVHDAIALFVITLVAGVLLGLIYSVTLNPIKKQEEKNKKEAYAAVYAGAEVGNADKAINEKLAKYSDKLANDKNLSDVVISEVLPVKKDGADAGYVATCSGKGYGGNVVLALGISKDGKIQGIQVTDCSTETPGLGQNSKTDWNKQYIGMTSDKEIQVVKDGSGKTEDGTINAISGATITSKAVTRAVNATLGFVKTLSE